MIYVLAPHIDDAILSIGGLIQGLVKKKKEVTVIYVFTISNWINPDAITRSNAIDDTVLVTKLRKTEEENVAKYLKYNYFFLDFEDFPIRKPFLNSLSEQLLIESIQSALKGFFNENDMCYFPIGIKHPDHQIVGTIGKNLRGAGYNIIFYEDIPYVADNEFDPEQFCARMKAEGFTHELINIDINFKLSLLKKYKSQMSYEWLNCVRSYSINISGNGHNERIWK